VVGDVEAAFELKLARPSEALGKDKEGDDLLVEEGVGGTDDGDVGDLGEFEEGAFDLKGADEVTAGVDDIVGAADIPDVAILVAAGEVTGDVEVAAELFAVGLGALVVGAEHGAPAFFEAEVALAAGGNRLKFFVADMDLDTMAGEAHGTRLDGHSRVVGDHHAAGLGLKPGVVDVAVEGLLTPGEDLGVERLADAVDALEAGEIGLGEGFGRLLHEHAEGGGGSVPDRDAVVGDELHPVGGAVAAGELELGDAGGEGGDDAVDEAGDPGGVSGAPEEVAGGGEHDIGEGGAHVFEGAVDVEGAFGLAGGAGGVLEEGGGFGVDLVGVVEGVWGGGEERVEGEDSRGEIGGAINEEDMLEGGKLRADGEELGEEAVLGDDHSGLRAAKAVEKSFFAEGGEEDTGEGEVLESGKKGGEEKGAAREEDGDDIGRLDAEVFEDVGEPVGLAFEVGIGEVGDGEVWVDPADAGLVRQTVTAGLGETGVGDMVGESGLSHVFRVG